MKPNCFQRENEPKEYPHQPGILRWEPCWEPGVNSSAESFDAAARNLRFREVRQNSNIVASQAWETERFWKSLGNVAFYVKLLGFVNFVSVDLSQTIFGEETGEETRQWTGKKTNGSDLDRRPLSKKLCSYE